MNLAKQRIALAEAHGWKWEPSSPKQKPYKGNGYWIAPNGDKYWYVSELPDYLKDFNALHSLIKTLTPEQIFAMDALLSGSCEVWLCEASQVAEAILRVLKLWTGGDTAMVG